MKTLLASIILIISISCGKLQSDSCPRTTDSQFIEYVESYEEAALQYANLDINARSNAIIFGDTGNTKFIAVAIQSEMCGYIVVDKAKWMELNNTQREIVIFHELTHIVLGQIPHRDGRVDGRPVSIMGTYLLDDKTYEDHLDYYLTEIFTRR